MFERIGNAEARAEYKQIKKAEKLYLGAVEKAGYAYVGRKIISYRPDEELDASEEIQYNRKYFKFLHKNLPTEKESGSEAHRLAVWWARRPDVQTGDQTLISMNDRWYLVERFDDADNNYQVEEFITKAEFEKIYKEIKEYGRSGKIKSVSGGVDRIDSLNRQSYSLKTRKSSIDSNEAQYRSENNQIERVDSGEAKRRERAASNGDGDSSSGSADRQGQPINFSLKDSNGNSLTEEQAKFFADSKIRDDDGNLLVVYHGSKANATVFKKEYISSWNMFGRGYYFTSSKKRAEHFAKGSLKKVYLNIENPFFANEREYLDLLYAEINNTQKDIEEYSEEKGVGGREFFKICNYLDDIGVDVSKILQDLGFDGVYYEGYEDIEVVAYESKQIKLTTNETPTTSEDIRFSLKADINDYTEKQYNDFGWARVNGVLSYRENGNFRAKYREIKSETQKDFHRSSSGEIIVETNDMEKGKFGVNNVLVFAKGSYENYKISRVVRLNLDNETSIEQIRDLYYEIENSRTKYPYTALDIIESVFGKGIVAEYTLGDFANYQEIKAQRGRQDSRIESGRIDENNQREQNGRRNLGENQGTVNFSLKDKYFYRLTDGQVKLFANNKTA